MDLLIEQIAVYGGILAICAIVIWLYIRAEIKRSRKTDEKIHEAMEAGVHEPVSLHPMVNPDMCIGTGACITACPEKDILGMKDGRATLINASSCVGHGACFHACPVEAITLVIGTEKRGVDLPHVNQSFETNFPGIYIAGELGGMGLIKNSVEQGKQAMDNIKASMDEHKADHDVVIVGAGPAGISAALNARKHGLKFVVLEQDSLGGTVYTFPRSKIVMTHPMELPLHGKVKLHETSKSELLGLWETVLSKNDIKILEHRKVEAINKVSDHFEVTTANDETYRTARVLLAIGRRGTPRKLNVPGEATEKVAYRLIEPELVKDKRVLVVGGGDSAVEAAMSLMDDNEVTLSYRSEAFKRIKPGNRARIKTAIDSGKLRMEFSSNLKEIHPAHVNVQLSDGNIQEIPNDLVYIFAGGELPTAFLQKSGVQITRRFGYAMMKHERK